MRLAILLAILAGCEKRSCERTVGHGMDLAVAELERSLAGESEAWRERARAEAAKLRADALARCKDRGIDAKMADCTMKAKTYQELLKCPGWK